MTKFLSLDKCLPHREFLQVREHLCYILSVASSSNMLVCLLQIVDVQERPGSFDDLEYDPEWLAILKATNSLQRTTPYPWNPPENNGLHKRYTDILTELTALICSKSQHSHHLVLFAKQFINSQIILVTMMFRLLVISVNL